MSKASELRDIICVPVVHVESGQTTIVWEPLLEYLTNPTPGTYLLNDHRRYRNVRTAASAADPDESDRGPHPGPW